MEEVKENQIDEVPALGSPTTIWSLSSKTSANNCDNACMCLIVCKLIYLVTPPLIREAKEN